MSIHLIKDDNVFESGNLNYNKFIKYFQKHAEKTKKIYGLKNRYKLVPASSDKSGSGNFNNLESDGVPVLARNPKKNGDINRKITFDAFSMICDNKAAYLSSNIQRIYPDGINEEVKKAYKNFDYANKMDILYMTLMTACAGWGSKSLLYEITSASVDDGLPRLRTIENNRTMYFYGDNENEPEYAIIIDFIDNEEKDKNDNTKIKTIFVYDSKKVYAFERSDETKEFILRNEYDHGFDTVPLINFKNDEFTRGNAERSLTIMDAYDFLHSDWQSEAEQLRSVYIFLKNVGVLNDEMIEKFKVAGAISGDENSDAKFLEKNINPTFILELSKILWGKIFLAARSYDPEVFINMTQARNIQIQSIFLNMENDAKQTERFWQYALQRSDELFHSYMTKRSLKLLKDYDYKAIEYKFHRSTITDILTDAEQLVRAGGRLSNQTLLEHSNIIKGLKVQEELDRIAEQDDSMADNIEDI